VAVARLERVSARFGSSLAVVWHIARVLSARSLARRCVREASTVQFVGHAMALQIDDSYLDKPAIQTVEQIQLYCYSLDR
jgi:Rab GDP dissociation inhibitor